MREDNGKLLGEFCMAGFEYTYESFALGRTLQSIHAASFFIFHDEKEESKMKEMLMGHSGCPAYVITNEKFYQE